MVDTGLCKKVKIRFENFLRLLKPSDVAAAIISAQRKGIDELTVPRKICLFYNFKLLNIFHPFRLLVFPQRNPPTVSLESQQPCQRFL